MIIIYIFFFKLARKENNVHYLEMSPLLLLFAKPSLAFEINPDISLTIRFDDLWSSSLGLLKGLLSFCVKSLTFCSRFNCRNTFSSSFSFSFPFSLSIFHKTKVKSIFYE